MDKPFLIGGLLGKDLLICVLCSEYYKDPRILPCQDTFCRKCLQNLFDERQGKTSMKITTMPCPKCHKMTVIPQIGVSGFPLDMNIRKKKEEFMNKLMDNVGSTSPDGKGTGPSKANSLPRTAKLLLEERQREQKASQPSYMKNDWGMPTSPDDGMDYLKKSRPSFSPGTKRNKIVDGLIRSRRERSPHVSTRNAPSATPLFTPMDPYVDEETHANRPFSGSRPSRLASPRVRLHSGTRHKSDPGFNKFKSPTSPDGFLSPDTSTSSGHSTPSPLSPEETNNNIPGSYKMTEAHDMPRGDTAYERPSRSRRQVHFQENDSNDSTDTTMTSEHCSRHESRVNPSVPKVVFGDQKDSSDSSVNHSQGATRKVERDSGSSGQTAHKESHKQTSNIKLGTSPIKLPAPPITTPTSLASQKPTSTCKSTEQNYAHSSSANLSKQPARTPPSRSACDTKTKPSSLSPAQQNKDPKVGNMSATSPGVTKCPTTPKLSSPKTSPCGEEAKVETMGFSDKVRTSPGKVRRRPSIPTSLRSPSDESLSPDGRKPYVSPTRGSPTKPKTSPHGKTPQFGTNSLPRSQKASVFTFDGVNKTDKVKDIVNKDKHSSTQKRGKDLTSKSVSSGNSDKNTKNISSTKDNFFKSGSNRKIINNAKNDVTTAHIVHDKDIGHVKGQEMMQTKMVDMGHVRGQEIRHANDMGHVKGQYTGRNNDKDMGHAKVQEAEHIKGVPGSRQAKTSDTSMQSANTKYPVLVDKPSMLRASSSKGPSDEILETDKRDVEVCQTKEINVSVTGPLSGTKSSVKPVSDTTGTRQTHSQRNTTSQANGYKDSTSSATDQHAGDFSSNKLYEDAAVINKTTVRDRQTSQHRDEDNITTQSQGRGANVSTDKISNRSVCNDDTEITRPTLESVSLGAPGSNIQNTVYAQEEVTTITEVIQQQKVINNSESKCSAPKTISGTAVITGPKVDKISGSKHQESINRIDPLKQKKYTVNVEKARTDSGVKLSTAENKSTKSTSRTIPIIRNGTSNSTSHNKTRHGLVQEASPVNKCKRPVETELIHSTEKDIKLETKSEHYSELKEKTCTTVPEIKVENSEDTLNSPSPGVNETTDSVFSEPVNPEKGTGTTHDSPWKTIYQDIYNDITREVSEEREQQASNRSPSSSLNASTHDVTLDTTDDADCSSLKDDSTQTPGGRISSEERQIGGATNLEEPEPEVLPEEEDMTPERPIYSTSECWSLEKRDYEMPTSIVVLSNGTTVVAEFNSGHLQYFDDTGTFMHSVSGVKPFCIAINKQDQVIIADRKHRTIRGFDEYGVDSIQWEDDRFKWISGIGCLNNGNLVIYDRNNYKVGIYTMGGDKVYEFGSYGERDTQLCMADFLTVDSKDRILLCDSGNHCIKMFDVNGRFLQKFGTRGHTNGQMEWPKGICCDNQDNIIVADNRNNRISLYSPDGEFIQHLVKDFPNPYAVCRNGANNLLGMTHYALSGFSQLAMYSMKDFVIEDATDSDNKIEVKDVTDGESTANATTCIGPGEMSPGVTISHIES